MTGPHSPYQFRVQVKSKKSNSPLQAYIQKERYAGVFNPANFLGFPPNLGIFSPFQVILGHFRQFQEILGDFRPFLGQIFCQYFFAKKANSASSLVFRMYGNIFWILIKGKKEMEPEIFLLSRSILQKMRRLENFSNFTIQPKS